MKFIIFVRLMCAAILLMLVAVVLAAFTCSCAASTSLPVAAAPVMARSITPSCALPPAPRPFHIVGYPDPDGATHIFVSKSDLAGFDEYMRSVAAFASATKACLER